MDQVKIEKVIWTKAYQREKAYQNCFENRSLLGICLLVGQTKILHQLTVHTSNKLFSTMVTKQMSIALSR